MQNRSGVLVELWQRLKSWEGFLLVILISIFVINSQAAPNYLTIGNQINLFNLSIEKAIVAITMAFLIINGEIDLSAPSIMGLSACVMAAMFASGTDLGSALVVGLLVGVVCGLWNGFWVAIVGLNSLVVTLAMLISYRGIARIFIEDRSIGGFPAWFNQLGQQSLIGPFPLALLIFFGLFALGIVILHFSGFGRRVYVIGNSQDVARYSGVRVKQIKLLLYVASGLVSALAGLLLAARFGAVRGDLADGFLLDIVTMVLLGGVSIFGGSGTLYGVFLSILIILNVRNGMSLASMSGHLQTGVIGLLLIFSVLGPNLVSYARDELNRRRRIKAAEAQSAS